MTTHGYVDCGCPTCFDTAVCSAPAGTKCRQHEHHLCAECEAAGCNGHDDCAREDVDDECFMCGTDDDCDCHEQV